jgi:diguanylate cyclase (GGDEF)-like protein/PAS domain S-box-containing protein
VAFDRTVDKPAAGRAARPPRSEASFWHDLDQFWGELVRCHNDVPALLRVIAERVIRSVGDGCVITQVTDDGMSLHAVAVEHRDPVVASAMEAVLAGADTAIGEGIAGSVAADRRSVVLNELPVETVTATTPAQFLPFVRDHPMRALLVVPLLASGELVGTLGAVRTRSADPYTPADLRLLEALGERAALAMADAVTNPRAIGASDYQAIYLHNLDGVMVTTPDGHVLAANPAACELLRLTEREIVNRGRELLVVAEDDRLERALAERAAVGHARAELLMRRGDGSLFWADVSSRIFTTTDERVRAVVIFRDISDQVAAREAALARFAELEEAADRDPLTGLYNRRGFSVAARHALAGADRDELVAQVLYFDLVGLKRLNDEAGHAAGDAALRAVAGAMVRATREVDVLCRLGGDEFAGLLVGTPTDEVERVFDRIRAELAADPGAPARVEISTGRVERHPHDEESLADLLDAVDRAMYQQRLLRRLQGDG